jgi:hypothetical protein
MIVSFTIGVIMISVASWQLLTGHISSAGYLFGMTALGFFIPGLAKPRANSARRLRPAAITLLAISTLTVAASHFASATICRIICHPAVVIPLWLFLMWGMIRWWQWQKQSC